MKKTLTVHYEAKCNNCEHADIDDTGDVFVCVKDKAAFNIDDGYCNDHSFDARIITDMMAASEVTQKREAHA